MRQTKFYLITERVRKTVSREIEFFRSHARRMMYAAFRREGYFIGSGVVEAGCKTVVGKRAKQSGMFWRVEGAQNILQIRCAVLRTPTTSTG